MESETHVTLLFLRIGAPNLLFIYQGTCLICIEYAQSSSLIDTHLHNEQITRFAIPIR